ncbi:MAG: TRM11 family SAM-dependent methyltransferase [Nanobdellota archaeon]
MNSTNTYILSISQFHQQLALAEITSCLSAKIKWVKNKWVCILSSLDKRSIKQRASECAFVTDIYKLEYTGLFASFLDKSSKYINNSYYLHIAELENKTLDKQTICDMIYHSLNSPQVSLHNPENTYLLLFADKQFFFAQQLNLNTSLFQELQKNTCYQKPTSIDPRIARVMIQLSQGKTILDPFCGYGGILLQAASLGKTCYGGDINNTLLSQAKRYFLTAGYDAVFRCIDARYWDVPVDAIVTDIPFGKNSSLPTTHETLMTDFFKKAEPITSRIILGCLENHEIERWIKGTSWNITSSFTWKVHRSMIRRIVTLEK